ncbi:hypothetical protein [uncultured Sphingomonas sp.]|uniref:hypothetical protein n=1 Tax=uncultured Sphingomonas sp. TaxID=158754 RepID=UPI0025D31F66|nr:hypothetical protein [uncultured Sphingomonas sp.]
MRSPDTSQRVEHQSLAQRDVTSPSSRKEAAIALAKLLARDLARIHHSGTAIDELDVKA